MKDKRIYGMKLPVYLVVTLLVTVSMCMEWLPDGMIGALAVIMVYGGLFHLIGNHMPIIRTYLGGGAVFCIFASAGMVTSGIMPESVVSNVAVFINETGFTNFCIAALITGSILGMDRSLLLRISVRFLPVAFCSVIFATLMVGVAGLLVGYGFLEAIMFIAIPMMSGGMGAGVIPLSEIYAQALGQDSSVVISRLIPASTLGNMAAIAGAVFLAKLGELKPALSGNGMLMRKAEKEVCEGEGIPVSAELLGTGLLISLLFYLLGTVMNHMIPAIHTYAWLILGVIFSKGAGIVSGRLEQAAKQWTDFIMKNWTSALLTGIGIAVIDLHAVADSLSVTYLFLVLVAVSGVALGAGAGGLLVGFFPIESAITAGLCTANMGGTGNIAVLSACKRMELLPFAQMATRICGALILIISSILVRFLF